MRWKANDIKLEIESIYTKGSDYNGKITIPKKLVAYFIFKIILNIIIFIFFIIIIILLFFIFFKLIN